MNISTRLSSTSISALLEWIVRLKNNPFREVEFVEFDAHGREHQVAIVGSHAVSWWVDSPVREIKVETIRNAGT